MTRTPLAAALAVSLVALTACGGGGGAASGAGPSPAPAAPSGASRGVLAPAAGTVAVNGRTFSTAGATVRMDDAPASASAIAPGMVGTVRFDDRGAATEIEIGDDVRGRVSGRAGDVVLIGEHAVEVDAATELGGAARLDDLSPGDRVRVYGHGRPGGSTRATRIEREAGASEDFEIKGWVSGLVAGPPAAFTLKVTPDASTGYAVTLAPGVALPANVRDGSFVEVRAASAPAAGALVAAAVALEDASLGGDGAEVEVEGLVSSGDATAFVVDGQAVVTDATTRWENGVPSDLAPDVRVEAEGHLASGALRAEKVSFRANVRLQGPIANVDLSDPAHPTFLVLGVTVHADAFTELEPVSGAPMDLATIAGPVEVRGSVRRDGGVSATRVGARGDDRPIVQGPVTASDASAGTLGILGITVRIGAATELPGFTTREAFFAAVVPGATVVKARGADPAAFSAGALAAKEAEIEGSR
jgi:hypothetical protein